MTDFLNFIAMFIPAILTVIGIIALAAKFIQPLNEINVGLVKLNLTMERLISDSELIKSKVEENSEKIDEHSAYIHEQEMRIRVLENTK